MNARRLPPTLGAVAAALLYGGAMATSPPIRDVFAFDPDEGINAGKALLLSRGATLYAQIWNDQPPLFTYLLRGWCDLVGWTIADARLLVLVFAALLVFAIYDIARLEGGQHAGALAALAVAAGSFAPRLSLSLMIGLPAIAFAMLAVWALFRWLRGGRDAWLALAGALFAASLATKLFTAFLLPIIAVWLWVVTPRRRNRALALWLASTLLVFTALMLALVGPAHLGQLVGTHIAGRSAPALQRYSGVGLLVTTRAEWLLTPLGWLAFAWLWWWPRRRLLLFAAWALIGGIILLTHHPFWYHHQLLLSVAYCPAIGVALADALRAARWTARPRWRLAPLAVVSALLLVQAIRHVPLPPAAIDVDPFRAVEVLRAHLGPQRVVLTSNAMYAFRAGATVPPRLVVLSNKRAATDPDLEDAIIAAFSGEAPEAVLVTADSPDRIRAAITQGMGDRYVEVLRAPGPTGATVSVRRDLRAAQP
jgi:hypothetical protein